jgi:hypothetical protein
MNPKNHASLSVEGLETREVPTSFLQGLLGSSLARAVGTQVFPLSYGVRSLAPSTLGRAIQVARAGFYGQLPPSWVHYSPATLDPTRAAVSDLIAKQYQHDLSAYRLFGQNIDPGYAVDHSPSIWRDAGNLGSWPGA